MAVLEVKQPSDPEVVRKSVGTSRKPCIKQFFKAGAMGVVIEISVKHLGCRCLIYIADINAYVCVLCVCVYIYMCIYIYI